MKPVQIHYLVAALTAALATTACSSATGSTATAPQPTSEQDLAAIAKVRADSARRVYTEADVHFMTGMIGHHAQAIKMAELAPTHDASASLRTLAGRIINAQQDEITIMQQWLRDRGKPVPDGKTPGMKMMMNGVEHDMVMPGMLTEAQMKQLDEARGAEFDHLFLTFMIQHHRGAVEMVKELFGSHGAALDETVFKFASDVNVDQTTEIARMERMLFAMKLEGRAP